MSYAIVFSSKTGNTKLLADTLHSCLPQESCCYFGTPDPAALEADELYVGFWTDKGTADESTLDFLKQLHGKKDVYKRQELYLPAGKADHPYIKGPAGKRMKWKNANCRPPGLTIRADSHIIKLQKALALQTASSLPD